MPRAGHHATEMVLRYLLRDAFAYCEHYTVADCCKEFPCARAAAHAAGGARIFMQKSHDHLLADSFAPGFDGALIQVREPVTRALSNYELNLQTVGPPHSLAYQKFWLGMEAAYTDGFFRKWRDDPVRNFLMLRYEDLVSDPAEYFHRMFKTFGIPNVYFGEASIKRQIATSSAGAFKFEVREPTKSRYYSADAFAAYASIVAPAAALAGYPEIPGAGQRRADPDMQLAYKAFSSRNRGDLREALADFDRYLAQPDAQY